MPIQDHVEIVSSRVFAFHRDELFSAFSDPARLAEWWGPDGFTNVIHDFEFRPGGNWRVTMTASNGTDFLNHSTFGAIVEPEHVTYTHHGPVHEFDMDMRFEAVSDHISRLTWRMMMEASEETAALAKFIALANEQNFDRLEAHLQTRAEESVRP
ncbi:SRPBCC domain-containing protein [Rhizobium sp. 0TCS1.26]|uniref:SRPBCC domain-containing protein n=1 Tax=Rhizobium sp. 0TCS1.26 TaxID=3142623 RepID=UPI003D2E6D35